MRSEFTALVGDIPLDLKMRTLFFSLCGRLALTPRRLGLEDKLDLSVKLAWGYGGLTSALMTMPPFDFSMFMEDLRL